MDIKEQLGFYTEYLRKFSTRFNNSEIARRIKVQPSILHFAINGMKDSKGIFVKIPKRCLKDLKQYFNEMGLTEEIVMERSKSDD